MGSIELAWEDDAFFADLNRQISLLIEEEDDDDDDDFPVANYPPVASQGYHLGTMIHHHPPIMTSSQYLESFRREMCKGTGVFIPQSSQPSRKYKQGKRSQSYAKSNNKQLINSRRRTTNVASHTKLSTSYDQ